MKKIISLFSFLAVCVVANAQLVSASSARHIAKEFMARRGVSMDMKNTPYAHSVSGLGSPKLYVCQSDKGKGFVVVSASDNTESILGYSDSGEFDPQDIPSSMRWWLDGMSREVAHAAANGVVVGSAPEERDAIEPLCKTKWNQAAPYNMYAPQIDGVTCPVGCAATCMAQIMYYHKWPQSNCSKIDAYTTYTNKIYRGALAPTTFDWDKMQETYTTATEESKEAVAKLMNYVDQALKMDFRATSSGAWPEPSTFRNYFGYYSSARRVNRSDFTTSQWDETIYNELKNKRPVFYVGYTPGGSGHGFICDGYDGAGLYHINWGWGGHADGFYRLSVLNPNSTTEIGAASTDDGFTNDQSALIGIQPDGPDNTLKLWPLSSITYEASTRKVKLQIEAKYRGAYQVSVANIPVDGATINPLFSATEYAFISGYKYTYECDLRSLSDGTYKLYGIIRANGEEQWERLGSVAQYAEVVVKGGVPTVTMHPILDYEVTDMYFPNNILINKYSRVNIHVRNNADEFSDYLYAFTGTDDNLKTKVGEIVLAMLGGEEFEVSTSVLVSSTDNFTIGVASDSNGQNVLFKRTFYDSNLSLESSFVSWNPCVVTIRLRNNSKADYDNAVIATFYQQGKGSLGELSREIHIPAGGVGDAVFELPGFSTEKEYYAKLQYMKSELNTAKKSISDKIPIVYDPTGIADIEATDVDAPVYNLSGQRVGSDYKGVVISGGTKRVRR